MKIVDKKEKIIWVEFVTFLLNKCFGTTISKLKRVKIVIIAKLKNISDLKSFK